MLHEILRLIRVYHDLNQTEAAKRLGWSKAYICALEKGQRTCSQAVLKSYSRVFGIPQSGILLLAEQRKKPGPLIAPKTQMMVDWMHELKANKETETPDGPDHA